MPVTLEKQQASAERRWLNSWLAGPIRTEWDRLPPQVGELAPNVELADATGQPRRLAEFWATQPLLLLFLRHFGCSCLAERWDQLKSELDEFSAAGAVVVAVGQAEPERTAAVATRRGYPFPVLSDPESEAYQAFGLLEGRPAQVLHDFPWRPNDRKTAEEMFLVPRRGTERAVVDNPWQLPGEFVIRTDGRIAHAHRYQYCEDFPPKTVLLGAIAAALQ